MAKNVSHMRTASVVLGEMRNRKTRVHAMLADAYLLLTRELTEESRTDAMQRLNDAMREIRTFDEGLDYTEIALTGVDGELREIAARLSDMRIGYALADSPATNKRNTESFTEPRDYPVS